MNRPAAKSVGSGGAKQIGRRHHCIWCWSACHDANGGIFLK